MQERSPIAHHAYVEGVHTRTGRDGRVYRLCRVCDDRANAGLHRGFRTTPATIRERGAHHAFQPGGPIQEDARGRRSQTCGTCGRVKRATEHGGPDLRIVGPETTKAVAPERRPDPVEAAPPPPRRVLRPEKVGAELVALAITLDTILALPADRVSWKVRVKMVALRDAIPLAQIPSMADPVVEVEDAPSEYMVDALDIAPRARTSVGGSVGPDTILRGVRNGRARALCQRAIRSGWTATKTGGGHIALDHGSQRLIVSTTSNDRGHGWANLRATAKRLGIDVAGL